MDTGELECMLKELVKENTQITDSGIGAYECWGQTGVDKQMGLEYDGPDITMDITDCLEEDDTPESIMAKNPSLSVEITKSGGGDPDACAESGRRHCGACSACDEYTQTFSVKLLKVEKKDGAFIGHFDIGG